VDNGLHFSDFREVNPAITNKHVPHSAERLPGGFLVELWKPGTL
jgi:hypothetical protein